MNAADIPEAILTALRERPGQTSEELYALLGPEGVSQNVLAGFLGQLNAHGRIRADKWAGTNGQGKTCHLYYPVE